MDTGQARLTLVPVVIGMDARFFLGCTVDFPGGPRLEFSAPAGWGLVPAFGSSQGTARFSIPPEALIGTADFDLSVSPLASRASWYRDNNVIGSYSGGGFGLGAYTTSGTGEWKASEIEAATEGENAGAGLPQVSTKDRTKVMPRIQKPPVGLRPTSQYVLVVDDSTGHITKIERIDESTGARTELSRAEYVAAYCYACLAAPYYAMYAAALYA